MTLVLLVALIIFASIYIKKNKGGKQEIPKQNFPKKWRTILQEKVIFYRALSINDKYIFEFRVHQFLLNYKIKGVKTTIDDLDRILIASSAIIPIFGFPDWHYPNLDMIVLYPKAFNRQFETNGVGQQMLGLVGNGFMDGKMILSKPALHHGFANETDKRNTAIHEFVHLLDMVDDDVNGIPDILMLRQYVIPWLDLMNKKLDEIYKGKSDINPYAGTNKIEFFAVVSEYFFERPKLLAKKHPKLYEMLSQVFKQDMKGRNLNHHW